MSLMNKFLTKSNSYNYYKTEYEKLAENEKKYKKEISDLKRKLDASKKELKKFKDIDKNKDDIYFLKQELIDRENKIISLQNQLKD